MTGRSRQRLALCLIALASLFLSSPDETEASRPPPYDGGQRPVSSEETGFSDSTGGVSIVLSDGQFVFGPNAEGFDLLQYLQENAPHLLPIYDNLIFWSAHPSINPRVMLTLIEMRTGGISNASVEGATDPDLFGISPAGVNEQLEEVAEALTEAYYHHLRTITPLPTAERAPTQIRLGDGSNFTLPPETNAATYGIARSLAFMGETRDLTTALDRSEPDSFYQTYRRLFPDDDPLNQSNVINISDPPPADLFQVPYLITESWTFNGVHNWSGVAGSDMSSIDMSDGWPGWGADTSNIWVAAAAPGTVTRYSGCWLRVTHSDGWMTAYYHLENPQVSTGNFVSYNQRLANYANTLAEATCNGGSSTGPHLHFALLRNGAYVAIHGTILSGWSINATCPDPYDTDHDCMYLTQDGVRIYAYEDPLENQGVIDTIPPTVTGVNSNPDTGDGELSEGEITIAGITELDVTFREFANDPSGDSQADDVTNPANYFLVKDGPDNTFQTTACGAIQGDDSQTSVNSVEYLSATQTATLNVNGGLALPVENYRLIVCGSTSVHDLADNALDGNADGTGGDDFMRSFVIASDPSIIPLPPNSVYGQPGFTTKLPNNGGISASSLNDLAGIAVDSSGGLYIADGDNHRVLYYPAASTTATRVYGQPGFTSNTANNGGISATSLNRPLDVAVDGGGVYIADADNHRVLYYPGASTTATRVYGQPEFSSATANNGGIGATSLYLPSGVAVNAGVYIVDNINHRVLFYSGTSTTATRVYGQGGSFDTNSYNKGGRSATSLAYPSDIAVNSAGVYLADADNDRVLYYSGSSTTASRVYGQPDFISGSANNGGLSANSLDFPLDVAVDSSGGIYVADSSNHRVLYYRSAITTASQVYGQPGFSSGILNNGGLSATSLNFPLGVTVDTLRGNKLYISDNDNHRALGFYVFRQFFTMVHR